MRGFRRRRTSELEDEAGEVLSEMRGEKNEDMNRARVLKYRPNYQRALRECQNNKQVTT
jgi:hypothetical protein